MFKCKIFVFVGTNRNVDGLRSVEAYDHFENKWTNLPDMIHSRCRHGAVSMGNKMFVLRGMGILTCEVFDSSSGKFTNIKEIANIDTYNLESSSIVTFGNKILVYFTLMDGSIIENVHIYNVLKNEWYLERNHIDELIAVNSCSTIPIF